MNDTVPTLQYFFRNRRILRAILIDDQPWFLLHDFTRLIGYPHTERLINRLDSDQTCEASLRLHSNSEPAKHSLISESGSYAALIYYNHPENGTLRCWINHTVVPLLRSAGDSGLQSPRQLQLNWGRQALKVLDWRGELWVNFHEVPYLAGEAGRRMGEGWRQLVRRLRGGE
ncbi:Bro-N domain-containing protein [Pseudomonas aeruginosa]|uniref:BRO-N domain-containing protein n=1 Tax=Pseudomonas aeruginosa TaxID=287 RepID=UPI002952D092|nr:BRO family protein [Pseudomonas aeruginosa]MDV7848879.1 BRO family protein [Pseudomonas aeruginosa]